MLRLTNSDHFDGRKSEDYVFKKFNLESFERVENLQPFHNLLEQPKIDTRHLRAEYKDCK